MPSRSSLDLLLAFVGWFLLLVLPVSVAADVLSVSIPEISDLALVVALTLPTATWFWLSGRPVGPLGAWFFWTVALTLALGLPVMVTLAVLDAAPTTGPSRRASSPSCSRPSSTPARTRSAIWAGVTPLGGE